jgi:hypothetical protein
VLSLVDLKSIYDKLEELQNSVERLQAVVEIQNIMGLYETLLLPQTMDRVAPETFAMWMDDVSMEVSDRGVFVGPEGVHALFTSFLGDNNPSKEGVDLRGALDIHQLNTPMIEVAKDCKTAHAVWYSCGFETPFDKKLGKRVAKWCWGKYAAEFIKGDCGWRIWHMHWFRNFMNDYYKSWVDDYMNDKRDTTDKTRYSFIKPTTFYQPYNPNEVMIPVPRNPVPYDTHVNSDWIYGDWVKKSKNED